MRSISNDWVIRHAGRWLQLQPRQRHYGPAKSKALVSEYDDGRVEVYYRDERIGFRELPEPVRTTAESMPPQGRIALRKKAKLDHPWRLGYQNRRARFGTPPLSAAPVVLALPLPPNCRLRPRAQNNGMTFTKKGHF